MNGILDEDGDSSSEDDRYVVGIKSSRRRTNWRFCYDALNQQDVALLSSLQMQSNGIFTQVQGILISIGILTAMLAVCRRFRLFQTATDRKFCQNNSTSYCYRCYVSRPTIIYS
jgi:hypothetical protein